jgi:hypothetical protein
LSLTETNIVLPEQSIESKTNQLVRLIAQRSKIPYRDVWNRAYRDLYYLYRYDAKARKKKRNAKTALAVVLEDGMIDKLHAIVANLAIQENEAA